MENDNNNQDNYFEKRLAESLDNFRMAVNKLDYAINGLMGELENYKKVSTRKFIKCHYCKRIYLSTNGFNENYCSKDCEEKSKNFSWMP